MNGFNYLDCYLAFQEKFKPIKYYNDQKKIIQTALDDLMDVLNQKQFRGEEFVNDIKLIYPNYFTEGVGGEFEPIMDELICFNEKDTDFEDTKDRVAQHMSYYLTSTRFLRISKTLLESEGAEISSFYMSKKEANKYEVSINGDLRNVEPVTPLIKLNNGKRQATFPVDVSPSLIKGKFKSSSEDRESNFTFRLHSFESNKGEPSSSDVQFYVDKSEKINNVRVFCELFYSPLSSHFILLEKSSLLYVYSQTAQIGKESTLGYGGLFVLVKRGLQDDQIKNYIRLFQLVSDSISMCIAHNIMRERQKKESTKSAKAAIMSRNMSHNIGSHVMSYLKQNLGSINNVLYDNVLAELLQTKDNKSLVIDTKFASQLRISDKSNIDKDSVTALPFLLGLGHFISYLQERQDFIATISTDHIPYFSTVNFKDFIYDELNPDKRYERHKEDRCATKIDNHILGNIARSEGLGRNTSSTVNEKGKMSDIVIKFRDFDGNPVVANGNAEKDLYDLRDINVDLPGGVIGRQAIFSIIENIIRNAAKHGTWQSTGSLELIFDIKKLGDYPVSEKNCASEGSLSINEIIDRFYRPSLDSKNLYFVLLKCNIKTSIEDLAKIRKALAEDYINGDMKMLESNKGLKEMRISATWLRAMKNESECFRPGPSFESNINDFKCDRDWAPNPGRGKSPIIYAMTDENGYLQYIFCLQKPRVMAVITHKEELVKDKKVMDRLGELHCRCYTPKIFTEQVVNKSFEIILCFGENKDEDIKIYKKIRKFSSSRVVCFFEIEKVLSRNEFNKTILDDNCEIQSKENNNHGDHKLKDFYKEAIKSLSGCCKEDEIWIHDGKAFNNQKVDESHQIGNVHFTTNSNPNDIVKGKYIYRTHHETFEVFKRFMERNPVCEFVEGISGSNSTDRIIRCEKIDDIWFYKHLRAMKKKVAIFDERLFHRITGLDESDFTRAKFVLASDDKKNTIDRVKRQYVFDNSFVNSQRIYRNIIEMKRTKDELNKCIEKLYKENPDFRKSVTVEELYSRDYNAMVYHQKGVYVYTLIKDLSEEGVYNLVGVEMTDGKNVVNSNGYKSRYIYLAKFRWDKNTMRLKLEWLKKEQKEYHKFDFISIHQGLLDKLYNAFGFKYLDIKDMKLVITMKERLMRQFYRIFHQEDKDSSFSYDVFPGLSIHSGRSKPGNDEMPQTVPFIQYASLEHAVLDCKYSLVELLDYARYE